jgi:hypothetical protein
MSGIFGALFAVLGIFSLGLVFLPFAVLFSFVSLVRSASGLSASGFCAAIASSILTIIGFVVSPSTWLVLAGLIAAENGANHSASNPPSPPDSSSLIQTPGAESTLSNNPTPSSPTPPPDDSSTDSSLPDSSMPAATPPSDTGAPAAASNQPPQVQSFAAGAADRATMEAWFDGLSGSFKDGAEFWAANRSLRLQPTCESQESNNPPDFYQGCLAAKARLDPIDVRRLSDPNYRAGWNSSPT